MKTTEQLRADLHYIVDSLERDELRVLSELGSRLVTGAEEYGVLNLAQDSRKWPREAIMESTDLSLYLTFWLLGKEGDE